MSIGLKAKRRRTPKQFYRGDLPSNTSSKNSPTKTAGLYAHATFCPYGREKPQVSPDEKTLPWRICVKTSSSGRGIGRTSWKSPPTHTTILEITNFYYKKTPKWPKKVPKRSLKGKCVSMQFGDNTTIKVKKPQNAHSTYFVQFVSKWAKKKQKKLPPLKNTRKKAFKIGKNVNKDMEIRWQRGKTSIRKKGSPFCLYFDRQTGPISSGEMIWHENVVSTVTTWFLILRNRGVPIVPCL